MPQDNLISIEIPAEVVQAVMDAIGVINEQMKPYLIALTKEERKTLLKMGDRTIPFVEKVLEYAVADPGFVPSYMDVPEMQKDYTAGTTINQMYHPLEQLVSNMNDTLMLCGNEAYKSGLQFYNYVKGAAKNNVPSAKVIYEDLKTRFEKQAAKTTAE